MNLDKRQRRMLALVLVCAITFLIALHTRPVQRIVARATVPYVEQALGATVIIGELSYVLPAGRIWARDVEIQSHDSSWRASVPELRLDYVPWRGVDIELNRPALRVLLSDASAEQEEEGPSSDREIPRLPGYFHRVQVTEGNLTAVDGPSNERALRLRDTGVLITRGVSGLTTLRLDTGVSLLDGETTLELGRGSARATMGARSIDDIAIEVMGSRSSLSLSGFLSHEYSGRLDIRADVDATEWTLPSSPLRAGKVRFEGALEPTPLALNGTFRLNDAEVEPFGPISAEGRIQVDNELARVEEAALEVLGGVLEGSVEYALVQGVARSRLSADNFELSRLARDVLSNDPLTKVRGLVSATANVTVDPLRIWESLEGEADIKLTPGAGARASDGSIPLSGSVRITRSGGTAVVSSERLDFAVGDLRFEATLGPDEALSGRYSANVRSLETLRALVPEMESSDLDGRGGISGAFSGTVSSPRVTGEFQGELETKGKRLAVQAVANLEREALLLRQIHVNAEGLLATGSGRVDLTEPTRSTMRGTVDASFEWIRPFLPSFEQFGVAESRIEDAPDGHLRTEFELDSGEVRLASLEASARGANLMASGRYHLETSATEGELSVGGVRFDVPSARGTIPEIRARWSGAFPHVSAEATVLFRETALLERPMPNATLSLLSDGEQVEMTLRDERSASVMATATTQLKASYPTRVRSRLEALPLLDLARAFTDDTTIFQLRGSAELDLELTNVSDLSYRLDVEELVGALRGIGGGASAPFTVTGNLEAIEVEQLTLIGADTAIEIQGRVPLQSTATWDVSSTGALRLDLLNPTLEGFATEVFGTASLSLNVEGQQEAPSFRGDIELQETTVRVSDIEATDIQGSILFEPGIVRLDNVIGRALDGGFSLRGRAPARLANWTEPGELTFRVMRFDLTRFVSDSPPQGAQLLVAVNGTLRAQQPELDAITGSGEVFKIRTGAGGLDLENDRIAPFSWENGTFSLPSMHLAGGETDIEVSAVAAFTEDGVSFDARARGVFDNFLLNSILSPDRDLVVNGLTGLDFRALYEAGELKLEGTGEIRNNRVLIGDPRIAVSNVSGDLRMDGNTIVLEELRGDVGGGTVSGGGRAEIAGASLTSLRLQARAENVRIDYPDGLRSELNGELALTGANDAAVLTGEIVLSRGTFTKNISLEEELLGSLEYIAESIGEPSILDAIQLDVAVRTDDDVIVQNNLAELRASAIVRVDGTVSQPELSGRITANEGTLRLSGKNYTIESGRIELDAYPLEPARVDLSARVDVAGRDITVQVTGPVDDLTTRLTSASDDDLTEGDLASLLLTGRPLEDIRNDSRTVLQEQVADYFISSFSGLAQSAIGQALPFDQVAIEPDLVGTETDPGARLTLGKGLTDDLSIAYSVLLNNTDNQIWIVEYDLPKRLQVRAIRDEDNDITGSLSQEIRLDLRGRGTSRRSPRSQRIATVSFTEVPGTTLDSQLWTTLVDQLNIREGDAYDYWKIQDRIEKARALLRERGYLDSLIELIPSLDDSGAVHVEIRVDPGRVTSLMVTGMENADELQRYLTADWMPGFSPEQRTDLLRARAARFLFARRFYTAAVRVESEENAGIYVLTVHVEPGTRGRGIDFSFAGRAALTRDALIARLPEEDPEALYDWLHERTARLRQSLRLQYAREGYLDAEIGEPELSFDEDTRRLSVSIPVVEGLLHRAVSVELVGGEPSLNATLSAELALHTGDVFRLPDFVQDRVRIASVYRREGFPGVRVFGDLDRREHDVLVTYTIEPGERSRVGTVTIAGNVVTNPELIRRQLTFQEGAPLRRSELLESQRKLYELGVFRYADVRAQADVVSTEGPRVSDVTVEVSERPDLELDYGLRVSTSDEYETEFAGRVPNLFGRAFQLQLATRLSTGLQLYRTGFQVPFLGPIPWRTGVYLTREIDRTQTDPFGDVILDRSWNVTFQQSKRLRNALSAQWSYIFSRSVTELEEPDPTQPFGTRTTLNRGRIVASLIEDTRDSILQPTRGRFWNTSFEIAPTQLASEVNFVKLYGQLSRFRSILPSVVWASSYRLGLGWTYAKSTFLIQEDRFEAGGPNSIRGFDRNSLLAGDDRGGEAVVVLNQELRFPLWRFLRGVFFYDAGNVYEGVRSLRPLELRHAAGLGLRVSAPFGLLRLDWARVLDPLEGEQRSRLIFSLGHAF